jgi:hypothetical protein
MNRLLLVIGFVVLWCATAAAEPPKEQPDTVTIPLDQVWAFRMPGTRDVARMLRENHSPLFDKIRGALSNYPEKGSQAKPSFVVAGDHVPALKAAKAVLVEGKPPRTSFRGTEELNIFLFSRQCAVYVQLDAVQRSNNDIQVRYSLIPHEESMVTEHFALIPLGKLAAGKYRINIVRLPMSPQLIAKGFVPISAIVADSTVCKSSEFEVTD